MGGGGEEEGHERGIFRRKGEKGQEEGKGIVKRRREKEWAEGERREGGIFRGSEVIRDAEPAMTRKQEKIIG